MGLRVHQFTTLEAWSMQRVTGDGGRRGSGPLLWRLTSPHLTLGSYFLFVLSKQGTFADGGQFSSPVYHQKRARLPR